MMEKLFLFEKFRLSLEEEDWTGGGFIENGQRMVSFQTTWLDHSVSKHFSCINSNAEQLGVTKIDFYVSGSVLAQMAFPLSSSKPLQIYTFLFWRV